MRGGKDWNKKAMEPLFPRLHVKDTEKGGPKPPPRNRMAVYEELICPSNNFINGSKPMFPLHPNGGTQICHADSSGQVGVSERRPFPAFYGSTASAHKTPRLVPSSQFSGILSNIAANSAVKPLGYATSSISDKVEAVFPSSVCQGESVESGAKQHDLGKEKANSPSMKSSIQIQQCSSENRLKRASVCDQDQEDHAKMSASSLQIASLEYQGSSKNMALVSTVRTNVAPHESFLCSGIPKSSSQHSCQPDKRSEMLLEKNTIIILEDSEADQPKVLQNSRGSLLRTETCSGSLICDNRVLAIDSQCTEESDNKLVEPGVVHRNEDASDSTRMNNVTSVIVSPDDVVQMIGQENFWKIRQILVNQQRMFSAQVFELHRLVQVQKSIAGASHHFIEDSLCLHKGLDEESNNDKSPLSSRPLPSPPPLCRKTVSSMVMVKKPNTSFNPPPPPPIQSNDASMETDVAPGNSLGKHLFPPFSCNSNKQLLSEHQSSKLTAASVGTDKTIKPCSYANALSTPPPPPPLVQSSDTYPKIGIPLGESLGKMLPATCFYPPPENQWLVPFMSSEGLIYKPYPGPCLPNAAGFTAHLIKSCVPMNVPAGCAAYGIPASTQQGEGVVPGIPITMCYRGSQEHAVIEDMTSYFPFFSSHQKSDADRQGSTGSSSVERSSQDPRPLFPSEPIATHELESEKQIRAIKAVPRDGRSASETAMRIFQSIQEERKQNEVPSVSNIHK